MISISHQVVAGSASVVQSELQPKAEPKQENAVVAKDQALDAQVSLTSKKAEAVQKAEAAGQENQRSRGNGLLSRFANRVQNAWTSVSETVTQGVTVAKGVAARVKDTASSVVSEISTGLTNAKEPIAELKDRVGDLKQTALAMKDNVKSLVGEGVSAVITVGKSVLQAGASIAEGAKSVGQAFTSGKTLGQRFASVTEGVNQFRQAADPIRESIQELKHVRDGWNSAVDALQANREQFKTQWHEAGQSLYSVKSEVGETWQNIKRELNQTADDIGVLIGRDDQGQQPFHVVA
ncbi:hypothetical protein SAMN05660443_1450 [Marinospirillum celere]|uniref:Uncharacterized protein n=1 Tax=Marinospirillum celere TaxID=1122252 RepID=A0A1I1G7S7_9GAMM|nr:hypothetical protein [Marinospirillum celere]SFC07591.1 hypothetical protein SAMN05660443_1450 [Marinospirillum celere]